MLDDGIVVEKRQVHQVVERVHELLAGAADHVADLDHLAGRRRLGEQVGVAQDGRQRGPDFVVDVLEERRPHLGRVIGRQVGGVERDTDQPARSAVGVAPRGDLDAERAVVGGGRPDAFPSFQGVVDGAERGGRVREQLPDGAADGVLDGEAQRVQAFATAHGEAACAVGGEQRDGRLGYERFDLGLVLTQGARRRGGSR